METFGALVDKLSVVNLKIWHAEETAHRLDAEDSVVAEAKRRINFLNNQRNDLIQELDEFLLKCIKVGEAPVFPQFKDYRR